MRLNCNDIDIILDGLDDYRGLCEYDEVSLEKDYKGYGEGKSLCRSGIRLRNLITRKSKKKFG